MVGSMKAQYDSTADALYLQLGARQPDGVVEMAACVHVDTTDGGEIIGIEILNASEKINNPPLRGKLQPHQTEMPKLQSTNRSA